MPSLLELQTASVRGVFDPAEAAIAELIVPAGIRAEARLAVYRRNVLGNYAAALRDVYPVVLRLVGEPFFDRLARDYATQTPSRSGDLHDFGGELGAFLETLPSVRELPYLADVAALEWAVHRSFHARHAPALDPARLAAVLPERLPDLRFELHPAARLLRSPYPVLTIWRVNQPQWSGDQAVDLALGAEQVLIVRRALEVALEPLSAAEYAMLEALDAGGNLGGALAAALAVDAEFDLQAFLAAALTVLRGYCAAGRPDVKVTPW
ncbi:MAG TPA: DNA-binding domain-containing protein, partial [Burkholderiales bacterium]|nr:DNA-binding domain-containing protein [Burkholderiales bacterium]